MRHSSLNASYLSSYASGRHRESTISRIKYAVTTQACMSSLAFCRDVYSYAIAKSKEIRTREQLEFFNHERQAYSPLYDQGEATPAGEVKERRC